MISTLQTITIVGASTGTYSLGFGPLNFNASAKTVQSNLELRFGAGNVIVCSTIGNVANNSKSITGTLFVYFVGSLWSVPQPTLVCQNLTNGQITVTSRTIGHRLVRTMQHTCSIYSSVEVRRQSGKSSFAADPSIVVVPTYINVPCYYEATKNFSVPEQQGGQKETNILTADLWHFIAEQDISSGYTIQMTTPGHPLFGRKWETQGNTTVNAAMPGRPTDSQYVTALLTP